MRAEKNRTAHAISKEMDEIGLFKGTFFDYRQQQRESETEL